MRKIIILISVFFFIFFSNAVFADVIVPWKIFNASYHPNHHNIVKNLYCKNPIDDLKCKAKKIYCNFNWICSMEMCSIREDCTDSSKIYRFFFEEWNLWRFYLIFFVLFFSGSLYLYKIKNKKW